MPVKGKIEFRFGVSTALTVLAAFGIVAMRFINEENSHLIPFVLLAFIFICNLLSFLAPIAALVYLLRYFKIQYLFELLISTAVCAAFVYFTYYANENT